MVLSSVVCKSLGNTWENVQHCRLPLSAGFINDGIGETKHTLTRGYIKKKNHNVFGSRLLQSRFASQLGISAVSTLPFKKTKQKHLYGSFNVLPVTQPLTYTSFSQLY